MLTSFDCSCVRQQAKDLRGLLKLSYPIRHGVVEDWDDMQAIWQHMYREMNIVQDQHPVLLTEAPLNPRSNRAKTSEIFFESFNVPALYFQAQAILSLYASGRTTGVVLDVGDGVTTSVPVYEGFTMPHAIRRMDMGGRDVTQHLALLLRKYHGTNFHTTAEMEIVKEIKEKVCYVAYNMENYEKDFTSAVAHVAAGAAAAHGDKPGDGSASGSGSAASGAAGSTTAGTAASGTGAAGSAGAAGGATASASSITSLVADELELEESYKLPDGAVIHVGAVKFRAPEVLFQPTLVGSEWPGIPQLVLQSVMACDVDLRRTLLANVTLAGGSTLFDGFGDRLLSDLRRYLHRDTRVKIWSPPDRIVSAWIGGSILASLASFKKMWVTKHEYEDAGKNAIFRKMF